MERICVNEGRSKEKKNKKIEKRLVLKKKRFQEAGSLI